jgi:hypothetical protein
MRNWRMPLPVGLPPRPARRAGAPVHADGVIPSHPSVDGIVIEPHSVPPSPGFEARLGLRRGPGQPLRKPRVVAPIRRPGGDLWSHGKCVFSSCWCKDLRHHGFVFRETLDGSDGGRHRLVRNRPGPAFRASTVAVWLSRPPGPRPPCPRRGLVRPGRRRRTSFAPV